MQEFLEKLADIFDEEVVKEEDVLADFEEYDSLTILTIISYAGSEFNKTISAKEVKECKTAKALYNLIKG